MSLYKNTCSDMKVFVIGKNKHFRHYFCRLKVGKKGSTKANFAQWQLINRLLLEIFCYFRIRKIRSKRWEIIVYFWYDLFIKFWVEINSQGKKNKIMKWTFLLLLWELISLMQCRSLLGRLFIVCLIKGSLSLV